MKKAMAISLSVAMTFGVINPPTKIINNRIDVYADAFENSISSFPESYKPYLRALHKQHSNWTFTAFNTGLDFNSAVDAESSNNKSLVENAYCDFLKSNAPGDYNASTGKYIMKDSGRWVSASKNAVSFFMDPRNFIDEKYIFMFENLSYDSSKHTQAGVEGVLSGSFMNNVYIAYYNKSGSLKTINKKFSQVIMEAASSSKVSPYFIASKMIQEIGKASCSGFPKTISGKKYGLGGGSAINGKHGTYPGIYNFYNIGASDGADPVSNGLSWASSGKTYSRPWNTPEKSIKGGASFIGEKYINCGQYTPYFQRFNVNSKSSYDLYDHQYMTAVPSVAQEASITYEAYKSNGTINVAHNFVIPVYKNMPPMNTTIRIGSTGNRTGTVNVSDTLNARGGPSIDYDIVGSIKAGTKVTILDSVRSDTNIIYQFLANPYWYKVSYVDENKKTKTAYVSAKYVNLDVTDEYYLGVATPLEISLSNNEKVYYMTDDPSVATIDENGNITGKKQGTTTIRAYTVGGKFSAVAIKIGRIGVRFAKSKYYVPKGENRTVKANVYTALNDKGVTFTSADTKVATVDANGKVHGVNYGTTTITATTNVDKKTAKCTVQVVKPVEEVKLNKKKRNITAGKTYQLKVSYVPKDATVQQVKWSSSNKAIAKVSNTGLVTAVKPGTCVITAKSVEGGKTATCTINVRPYPVTDLKTISKGCDKLKLTWGVQPGVTGYIVFKQNPSTKKYEKVAVRTGASTNYYFDKNLQIGKKYRYKVRAYVTVNGKNIKSLDSAVKVGKTKPAKGKVLSVTNESNGVKVSFKAIKGATNYQISRMDSVTNKFKKLKIVKSSKTFILDKKAKKGVTYTYKVRALTKVGNKTYKGKFSKAKKITR